MVRSGPDLDKAVASYGKGRMDAAELHTLLVDTFGDQVRRLLHFLLPGYPAFRLGMAVSFVMVSLVDLEIGLTRSDGFCTLFIGSRGQSHWSVVTT